jgi:menaquinone-9 beta-reductase
MLFNSLPNGPELGRTQRVSPMMGVVEYPNLVRKTFTRGLALIGDRPCPSIRCRASALRLGLPIGRMARRGRRRDLANSKRSGSWPCGLRPSAQTCLAGHEFLISDFSTGRPYNPLERLMFSAATRDPICADHLAAFGSRSIGVSAFLRPSALTRAMWVNARHAADAHGSS